MFKKTQKIDKKSDSRIEIDDSSKSGSKETSESNIVENTNQQQIITSDSQSDVVLEGNVRIDPDGSITADRASIKNNTKKGSTINSNKKVTSNTISEKQDSTSQKTSEKKQESTRDSNKHSEPNTSTYIYILLVAGGFLIVFLLLKKLKVL